MRRAAQLHHWVGAGGPGFAYGVQGRCRTILRTSWGAVMVIVLGTGRVDPALRERFLAQRAESMRISRAEPGNLEYVIAADPIEADRVVLSERWETEEDLTAHLRAGAERRRHVASDEGPQVLVDFDIAVYEVSSAKPLA